MICYQDEYLIDPEEVAKMNLEKIETEEKNYAIY